MGNSSFDESALRITPSPPPSHEIASSAAESKYVGRVKILHYARIGISALFVVLGTAVIACEGHALNTYNTTHLQSEWWLPLWPQHFDLGPTIAPLVSAVLVTITSLAYLILALIPSFHSRTTLLNGVFTGIALANTLTLLIALGYTLHRRHLDTRLDVTNLQTWTCRWASSANESNVTSASASTGGGGVEAPHGFSQICSESKAAWGITITMVVVQAVGGAVLVVWGWWVGFRVWRARRKEAKSWGNGGGAVEVGWEMQNSGHNVAA